MPPPGGRSRPGSAPGADIEAALEALGAAQRRRAGRRGTVPAAEARRARLSATQRLLLLDTWRRSGLAATEFASLVGVSAHTLYKWSQNFAARGPAGLEDQPRQTRGSSRLPEPTRRAILLLKQAHPDWGQDRIHDALQRTAGFAASAGAIGRVLAQAGYVTVSVPTRPHEGPPRRFERARPNELWQTDLFTFLLKRENRRVYMVVFMDDHSRFIVGWALSASSSGELVREAFENAVANFGLVQEVLTDNGPQYHTWRGKSAFTKLLERRGVRQIVARPRRPQTLGKVERFWQTLWRECLEAAIFRGLDDARRRIGHFIGHYNFQRTHSALDGLVPADRFFDTATDVRRALEAQVAGNALELARSGEPRQPFYLTGRVGNETISLHAEGDRVVLVRDDGSRNEVDLGAPVGSCEGNRAATRGAFEAREGREDRAATSAGPASDGADSLEDAWDADAVQEDAPWDEVEEWDDREAGFPDDLQGSEWLHADACAHELADDALDLEPAHVAQNRTPFIDETPSWPQAARQNEQDPSVGALTGYDGFKLSCPAPDVKDFGAVVPPPASSPLDGALRDLVGKWRAVATPEAHVAEDQSERAHGLGLDLGAAAPDLKAEGGQS